MDIVLNDELEQLNHSVGRMLEQRYPFAARRQIVATEPGRSAQHWKLFAEMGLLAAPFGEEYGGLGAGARGTMVICQQFGQALVAEPFFETVVVAGNLIESAGSDAQRQAHLPAIMAGHALWALAWAEKTTRHELGRPLTRAVRAGSGYLLSGTKIAVVAAPWADKLIVTARTDDAGATQGEGGIGLFIVDCDAPGVTLKPFKTLDGRRAAEVTLASVQVPADRLIGDGRNAVELLEHCRDHAIVALCAEAVGAMTTLNALTLEYCKNRKQFGVPLGSFQVLQHRMVDMFIAREESLSLMQHLTLAAAGHDADLSRLASGAKARIGEAARFVGEQAIQLHGGMGMSDELSVGHYVKRLLAIDLQFGDAAYHLSRFAQLDQTH